MEETTIEKLNEDVLLEIFEYLNGSELNLCATVCKR